MIRSVAIILYLQLWILLQWTLCLDYLHKDYVETYAYVYWYSCAVVAMCFVDLWSCTVKWRTYVTQFVTWECGFLVYVHVHTHNYRCGDYLSLSTGVQYHCLSLLFIISVASPHCVYSVTWQYLWSINVMWFSVCVSNSHTPFFFQWYDRSWYICRSWAWSLRQWICD